MRSIFSQLIASKMDRGAPAGKTITAVLNLYNLSMGKIAALVFLLTATLCTFGQEREDDLITVHVADTADLYHRVRQAITFTNLIIIL